ncbi:cytochrome P450 [Peniophora sp. CONT]|nr:cytochrome P450 [Peniophora sp. CONT]
MAFFSDPTHLYGLAAGALVLVGATVIRLSRNPLKDIRGPAPSSFWLGNQGDILYQNEVGDVDFEWLKEYGGIVKTYGPLGTTRLMVSDPKALQYILQTSGYRYPKRHDARAVLRMIVGHGIGGTNGEQHQRVRKIMSPAFSGPQLQSFLPLFLRYSEALVEKWNEEEITAETGPEPVINVHRWLSRATLDIIGDAGFGFKFDALNNNHNDLRAVYANLFVDSTLYPYPLDIIFRIFWKYIPMNALWYLRYLPRREYYRFRTYLDAIRGYVRSKLATQLDTKGAGKEDLLSALRRANEAEEARSKITDVELFDQVSNIMLAGHDTTASTLTFWLWELAQNPEWQKRVREEVRAVRRKIAARGDSQWSIADYEGLTIMRATLNEAMRLHPIVWILAREAGQDDVIPLATPITTKSGQKVSSVTVRKGQGVDVCIHTYNRNADVWGPDANEWNPDRFIKMDKDSAVPLGLHANLLNFSGGIRGCIGFRFAILEMQAIAATLVEKFEFALPPQVKENAVKRMPTLLMVPMAEGHPGIWMGLKVRVANT